MRCVEFREYRKSTTTTNNSKLTRVFDLLWCELKIVPQSGRLSGYRFLFNQASLDVRARFRERVREFSTVCVTLHRPRFDARWDQHNSAAETRSAERWTTFGRAWIDQRLGRDADEVRVVRVAEKVQRHNSWRLSVLCVIMAARESALHC